MHSSKITRDLLKKKQQTRFSTVSCRQSQLARAHQVVTAICTQGVYTSRAENRQNRDWGCLQWGTELRFLDKQRWVFLDMMTKSLHHPSISVTGNEEHIIGEAQEFQSNAQAPLQLISICASPRVRLLISLVF